MLARNALINSLLIAGMIIASAAQVRANELSDFKSAIRAKYDIKERAFASKDPEPILTRFYTRDAISTGEGEAVLSRPEQFRRLYESVVGDVVRIESVYTHVNGDVGWDWANFHVTPADPEKASFVMKILFLWERINGEWWCKGDMFVMGSF